MPKISQLNPISQLTTSSILPVVDNGATQNVTLKRVVEFVSASIDVTFATEIELLQSASAITSSLNAFASASILSVNSKLSTSSFEAYTASVQSVNTSSLLLSSSFNTFTSSYKTDSASFDSRVDSLELINVSPFLSSSAFNTYTSSNNTTNTTQNSRLTSLENNSGSYLLKTETGSFILSSQTSSFITEAETGSFLTSLPNNLISGSTQISNLGFATTSSVLNIDTSSLVTTSSFNTFTSSYKSGSFTGSFSGSFVGNVTGVANNATYSSYVLTQNLNTNGEYSLVFAPSGSNGYLQTYTDGGSNLLYNPSTNRLRADYFSGSIQATNGVISGSSQISGLGYATTSSVLNIDTSSLVTTSSFNSYTASISTASLVSRLNSIENVSGSYSTTGSNTFVGNQIISGSITLDNGYITLDNGAIIKDNANSSIAFGKQAAEYNQGTQSVAIGNGAGNYDQNHGATAIGTNAGAFNQGLRATAIGSMAGGLNQGEYAVALGNFAGGTNQASHSIVINATGIQLDNDITSSLKIAPIRNITGSSGVLQYNDDTKEVSYSNIISGSTTFVGNQTIIDGNIYGNESAITLGTGQTSPGGAITIQPAQATIAFAGGAGVEWNFYNDGNTSYPGNLNGVLNLATTGSNTFIGTETISGSLLLSGSFSYNGTPLQNGFTFAQPILTRILDNASYTGASAWTTSYTGSGGAVIVTANVSGWRSSIGTGTAQLLRDGVAVASQTFYFNIANYHTPLPPIVYVSNSETGSHTYSIYYNNILADGGDYATINVLEYGNSAIISPNVISGSGQITNLGFATTSSVVNVNTSSLLLTSSFNTFATSSNTFSASVNSTTASLNIFSSSINTFTSSANTALSNVYIATASLNSKTGSYATTGSNQFNGNQSITGSLVVNSGTIISSSLTTNSSSLYLNSGSNLYVNDNGLVEITGSLRVSGSANFNVSVLSVDGRSGDEGGEINLAIPVTNTTLQNRVQVDIWQNRYRIFEGSANAQGVYVDLSKAPANVGGELMWKASGLVNTGTDVTLGNLKARIPSSGNKSLQLSTISGTYSVYGSSIYSQGGSVIGLTINATSPLSVSTTPAYLASGNNFGTAGATDTWVIMDTSNTIAWRITMILGSGFNNNMISIERLV